MSKEREIAERIAQIRLVSHEKLVGEIEAALQARYRAALEDAAKAAEGDPTKHDYCGHEAEYWDGRTDAAIAIRALASPSEAAGSEKE